MNKRYLLQHPKVFQGEKWLFSKKPYFEGWYFKLTNDQEGISFIPGIHINEKERNAFIQIITNRTSYYVKYSIDCFQYNFNPFYIKIDNNYFSEKQVHIDINAPSQQLIVNGDIMLEREANITCTLWRPNIMGPFSYLPFMECNHAILQMKACVDGKIVVNENEILFNEGISYIEKDWGTSFPSSYVWLQANQFENVTSSFMLSIAKIPYGLFHFNGLICVLLVDGKEYRFATYNNAKILDCELHQQNAFIHLKKGEYHLYVEAKADNGHLLSAPNQGKMNQHIKESISALIRVTLKRKDEVLFKDESIQGGLEIVE